MWKSAALVGAIVVLASSLAYARNINRTPPSNSPYPPGVTVPAVAAQWGLTKLVLYDDFSDISKSVDLGNQRIPGFNFYPNSRFQLVSAGFGNWSTQVPMPNDPSFVTYLKGGLQLLNLPQSSTTGVTLSSCYTNPTAGPLSGTILGLSFTGAYYAEIQMKIENVTHTIFAEWPNFFANAGEFFNGNMNNGGSLEGVEMVETDIVETVPIDNPGHVGLPQAHPNMHHWVFTATPVADDAMFGSLIYNTPTVTNLSLAHTYGALQVTESLTTSGLAFTHFILDGVDVGGESYSSSTSPNPALNPNSGVGFLTRAEVQHNCLMIGTGRNWPNLITKVQLWQRP